MNNISQDEEKQYVNSNSNEQPNANKDKTSDVAIAGFILSILGLICCMLPYLSIFTSVISLMLCIYGIRNRSKKDIGILGIIISSLALISSIIFTILWVDENSLINAYTESIADYSEGYSTYNNDSTYSYLDYALDKRSEPLTTKISNYNEVKIGDNIYTLPIDYAEFEDKYEYVYKSDLERLEKGLILCEYIDANMYIKEYKSKYYIKLYNFKDIVINDNEDLTIGYISTGKYYSEKNDISYIGDIEIYGGIRLGSTSEEVLEALGEPVYGRDTSTSYYEFDEISIDLTMSNGVVTCITISYYQDMMTILEINDKKSSQ